jgi:hypothetical protein
LLRQIQMTELYRDVAQEQCHGAPSPAIKQNPAFQYRV